MKLTDYLKRKIVIRKLHYKFINMSSQERDKLTRDIKLFLETKRNR